MMSIENELRRSKADRVCTNQVLSTLYPLHYPYFFLLICFKSKAGQVCREEKIKIVAADTITRNSHKGKVVFYSRKVF